MAPKRLPATAFATALLALTPQGALGMPQRGVGGVHAPPLRGLYVTFHGKLKSLNKKALLLEQDGGKILTFRRDKKTRFAEGTSLIKDTDVDLESMVTVFATEDNDLKLLAAGVLVDPGQGKKAPKSR